MSTRVTLQTIADAVGVSRTTVSNAYNRPAELSPDLRARILTTARELGYRGPDPAGRMLRTGRMGTIGLVFTDDLRYVFSDPDTIGFVRGVAETTAASGIGLSLLPVPGGAEPEATALASAPVDGYVVFSVAAVHPAVELVLRSGTPVVTVDEPDLGATASFVGIDDRAGARDATEHVVSLGHRRVALITHRASTDSVAGPLTDRDLAEATVRVSRARLDEAAKVLAEAGLAPVAVWDAAGNDQEAGQSAATDLLVAHPGTTAIVCTTDRVAIGAIRAVTALGRSVPGDVSIVGFDDIPQASACRPPLTTIRQPIVDKGRIAAELLLDQIGSGLRRRIELPIELVVRGSTAPPTDQ